MEKWKIEAENAPAFSLIKVEIITGPMKECVLEVPDSGLLAWGCL